MKNYKIIVAHPGQQHSYKTAIGIKKAGMLEKYITTVYNKKFSLTYFVIKFLKGGLKERAINRNCNELDDKDIIQFCEIDGLILLFLQRIDKRRKLYDRYSLYITKKFGIKVAKFGIKHSVDAIVVYDTQGTFIGRYLKKKKSNIKLIMDVSAANLDYMRNIYEKDIFLCPEFKDKMLMERGYLWSDKTMKYHREELIYPDAFLVPSNFVKKSLQYVSIDSNKIFVCPYGSYLVNSKKKKKFSENKLKLIYVGNTMALKGIWYLLEAVMNFSIDDVSLTVVGSFDNSLHFFDKYLNRVNFVGNVPHSHIEKYLLSSDVFIMPSLGEGLNLSSLEALGIGLPCILSKNTGLEEYIKDGWNGFIINIQDIDDIVFKIQWFLENMERLPEMGINAVETSTKLTWDNYYDKLETVMYDILK